MIQPNQTHLAELLVELKSAIANAERGIRDPSQAKKAAERMDQMREELRERIGTVDIAVELIRDARDP